LKIISAALKIHHLTNLNTSIIDQDGEFIFHHETISIPTFMLGANDTDISNFFKEINPQSDQLFSYTNRWGLDYLSYSFTMEKEYMIIIGPYMERTSNVAHLTRQYHLNNNESEDLNVFLNQIQILNVDKIHSYSSIIQLFNMFAEKDTTPIQIEQNEMDDK